MIIMNADLYNLCGEIRETIDSDCANFELTAWDVLMDNHLILARDRRGKAACRLLHTLQRQNQRLSRLIAALD